MNTTVYIDAISSFFEVVEGRTVLEIGPLHGLHTKIIQHNNPLAVTLVEPDAHAGFLLGNQFLQYTVENDDIFHYLKDPKKFDVVVCCGVLYHLHSPLYLLELIANNASPEYIILETFLEEKIFYKEEIIDIPGNRYSINWKSAKFNIVVSEDVMKTSMNQLGYQLVKEVYHGIHSDPKGLYKTKEGTTTSLWQKYNEQK